METFRSINDELLGRIIDGATSRVVYVAPGVGKAGNAALVRAMKRDSISLTIIIDSDEDAYRIGYGEPDALAELHEAASRLQFPLRRQTGLRIGMLVTDEQLVIWAPTARSVEPEPGREQPNAIFLTGSAVRTVASAVGSDDSQVLPDKAEVGREPLTPHELNKTVENLKANPPAPFDLAQKTRVFATRFQFVEFELMGAEWTERRVRLSSILLNADLPEHLQEIIDTQVRPFQAMGDLTFKVPLLVDGEPVFNKNGERIVKPATQAEMTKLWAGIRDRYLRQVKGFGWLIRRDRLHKFLDEVSVYEEALKAWVSAFRDHVSNEQDSVVNSIVESIHRRLERSAHSSKYAGMNLRAEVEAGLQRMRIIEPKVRIVIKNVSWESTRDAEFVAALQQALRKEDLHDWFEEYTAVRQRENSLQGDPIK